MPAPRNTFTLGITLVVTAILIGLVLVIGQRGTPTASPSEVILPQVEQPDPQAQPQPQPQLQAQAQAEPEPVEITLGQPAQDPVEVDPAAAEPPAPVLSFIEAAQAGDTERLTQLLEAGADPNAPTADGMTPLMRAGLGGHLEAIFLLLDYGANPAAKDAQGKTAADHAQVYPPIVRVLEGATPPEIRPDPSK